MSLVSLPTAHKRTDPLPAPDAARSLPLQRATELTQEYADEESKLSEAWSPFSAFWDPIVSHKDTGQSASTRKTNYKNIEKVGVLYLLYMPNKWTKIKRKTNHLTNC